MPDIKTFRADSMHEALRRVRQELGPEALILHTRQIPRKSLLPWQTSTYETEIVAALEEPASAPPSIALAESRDTASARWDRKPPQLPEKSHHQVTLPTATATVPEAISHTSEVINESSEAFSHRVKASSQKEKSPRQSETERLEQLFTERIDSLQKLVEQLSTQVKKNGSANWPAELETLHQSLIEQELDRHYARRLIDRLDQEMESTTFPPHHYAARLRTLIEQEIHCSGPITVRPGQQKIVALVGPTGVGKTTTIAKLAANFRLREGIQLGLITVDTYRIAAVEQLKTYAEIIDLPMAVVTSPDEMPRAIERFADKDLILIDTAGRSPQDELKIQELQNYLQAIVIDEIHLVLSATTGQKQLQTIIEKFQPIRPTAALITKRDETTNQGLLLNTAGKYGLPLSYFTMGQDVPQDIEPANISSVIDALQKYLRFPISC